MKLTRAQLQDKATRVYAALRQRHANAHCELDYSTPLDLLVATVLSAQCTDVRVNQVTASLFRKYRVPDDYLRVAPAELEADIRPTGFFRKKAESLRQIMTTLKERHGGQVPGDLDALTALSGVGRKTANVILGNCFGVPGIVVDTHVSRVCQRLGLTRQTDPEKIEADLMKLYPKAEWVQLSHTLVFHGRYLCEARRPQCQDCPVNGLCDAFRATALPWPRAAAGTQRRASARRAGRDRGAMAAPAE
jgi:endonuclease-3